MIDIPEHHPLKDALKKIADDVRFFIELSLQEPDDAWEQWLPLVIRELGVNCWEKKACGNTRCPAYGNMDGRCWLIAGTLCGGTVQGEFALKYKSCTECDVYQESVFVDPVAEIYEHLITLVHSLTTTQQKLRTMATKDLLTGVYNRNFFNETITREIEIAKRYGERLSVIMVDIDGFKKINDLYGHLHGDGILRECAGILKKSIGAADLLCRFGGDEFLIISPHEDCAEDGALTQRIHRHVREWNEECASENYGLSLSIGCAVWDKDRSLLQVISEADALMYREKHARHRALGA